MWETGAFDPQAFDDSFEIPHDFEIDLHILVRQNHQFLMEKIDQDEDQELAKLTDIDPDDARHSMETSLSYFYDDLRRAAHNQTIVALVTRLSVWIGRLYKKVAKGKQQNGLWLQLPELENVLGTGPTPIQFFLELVTVRDSVIHNNSESKWEYNGKPRAVAPQYVNSRDVVELTQEQVEDAIKKCIEQVRWYDEKLRANRTP
jgi:hypothetical protein